MKQEMLNAIVLGLRAQGKPGWSPNRERCMYRTPGGLKCAVGQIIPDDKYHPEMDAAGGMNVFSADVTRAVGLTPLNTEDNKVVAQLNRLQRVHDSYAKRTGGADFDEDYWQGMRRIVEEELQLEWPK